MSSTALGVVAPVLAPEPGLPAVEEAGVAVVELAERFAHAFGFGVGVCVCAGMVGCWSWRWALGVRSRTGVNVGVDVRWRETAVGMRDQLCERRRVSWVTFLSRIGMGWTQAGGIQERDESGLRGFVCSWGGLADVGEAGESSIASTVGGMLTIREMPVALWRP